MDNLCARGPADTCPRWRILGRAKHSFAAGKRVYTREEILKSTNTGDQSASDSFRRRRDPKTGRRSSELEDLQEERDISVAGIQQDQRQSAPVRQHFRAASPATITPGYVGARRHNNEL